MTTKETHPGLYVHVPFCASRCAYCAFHSSPIAAVPDWFVPAVLAEAQQHAGLFDAFDTLYLGGGTPSLLSEQQLASLFDGLLQALAFSDGFESTIEVNPGDVDLARLQHLRDVGFNRISIGVQSFRDQDLQFLGRRHDADQAVDAITSAQAVGFTNVGLDLIYGLPDQTRKDFLQTLAKAVQLAPQHLSCYALSVEPGTRLAEAVRTGSLKLPDDALQADLFMATSDFLEASGFEHYEVSNFACGPGQRSRHNTKYWNHTPYLGLGPSAHSFRENRRWWNPSDTDAWAEALLSGQSPTQEVEQLTPDQIALERLALGLRTRDGVPASWIASNSRATQALQRFINRRWVRRHDDRIVPTRRGFLFADHLARELS